MGGAPIPAIPSVLRGEALRCLRRHPGFLAATRYGSAYVHTPEHQTSSTQSQSTPSLWLRVGGWLALAQWPLPHLRQTEALYWPRCAFLVATRNWPQVTIACQVFHL
jgi:hypothetical protein